MHPDMKKLLSAKPIEEEDKAKIHWPKVKKWHRPRRQTTFTPRNRYRPRNEVYWQILKETKRNLNQCELCASEYKITIHHKDGNCFNNELDNLQVLCWSCHRKLHRSEEEGVIDEEETMTLDR